MDFKAKNTTVKDRLMDMLAESGMFMSQALKVVERAIPVLNSQAKEVGYSINWDAPASDFDKSLYGVWFSTIKPIALKWIDENVPKAWYRDMFVG